MGINYIPPPSVPAPLVYQAIKRSSDCDIYYATPYFYEAEGQIINLAAASSFYVDHIPLTSLYWPRARIAGNSYRLTPALKTRDEAMAFLRELTAKIEQAHQD